MPKRIPQSRAELEAHFYEQLGFLERSAGAFDAGYRDEAKRLAVAIRVLLHDTSRSRSLLSQLGRKGVEFCDSSIQAEPGSLAAHWGLVGVAVAPGRGVKYAARLDGDDPSSFRWIDFDSWWNTVVFRDLRGRKMTRRDVVLAVANQDGGAHVDPTLDEAYALLTRGNTLGHYTADETGTVALTGPELVAVRQIAHEVLKTLKPGYEKKPAAEGAAIIGGVSLHFNPAGESDEN